MLDKRKALKKLREAREESGEAAGLPAAPVEAPAMGTTAVGTPVAADEIDCPRCAERIKAKALECRFCQHVIGKPVKPGARKKSRGGPGQGRTTVTTKSPGVAAVLAFFWMGVGHIYAGQIGKGLALVIVWPVAFYFFLASGVLLTGKIGAPVGIGVAVAFLAWIWQIFDAHAAASKP